MTTTRSRIPMSTPEPEALGGGDMSLERFAAAETVWVVDLASRRIVRQTQVLEDAGSPAQALPRGA